MPDEKLKFENKDYRVCSKCKRKFLDDGYVDDKKPLCISCYAESINCKIEVVE